MSSFEERFYRENPGIGERCRRNLALLIWLARALWMWAIRGRRLRRAYRAARRNGDAVVLEDFLEPGAK